MDWSRRGRLRVQKPDPARALCLCTRSGVGQKQALAPRRDVEVGESALATCRAQPVCLRCVLVQVSCSCSLVRFCSSGQFGSRKLGVLDAHQHAGTLANLPTRVGPRGKPGPQLNMGLHRLRRTNTEQGTFQPQLVIQRHFNLLDDDHCL